MPDPAAASVKSNAIPAGGDNGAAGAACHQAHQTNATPKSSSASSCFSANGLATQGKKTRATAARASLRRACRAARAPFGCCYCAAFPGAAFARSVTTAASFCTFAWSLEVVAS